MPGDPRSARQLAIANIQRAQAKAQNSKMSALTAMLSSIAAANSEADYAAKTERAKVSGVDLAAFQKAQEAAQADQGGGQPDITQFFPPTAVGGAPGGGGPPQSFSELMSGAGGNANALANRAVAPARQAAGTLPSAPPQAPQQMAAGGGSGGQSVNVGGQTFSAPDTITTTRETTSPVEFSPGYSYNATTRQTTIEPNVLRAGDILQAKLSQQQFEQTAQTNAANFKLQIGLRTREAAAGMAADLMRATNAPPGAAMAAAGAYLSGNDEIGNKLLGQYGSVGAAQIAGENARARLYDVQARVAEAEGGLAAGTLFDPSVMLGLPPKPKPLTANEVSTTLGGVTDDLAKLEATGDAGGKAGRIENIGLRLSRVGQILVHPEVEGSSNFLGLSFGGSKGFTQLPATTVFGLLDIAKDDNYPDTAKRDAARATAESLGLGSVAVLTDKAGNKTAKFVQTTTDPAFQPWADRVHAALTRTSDETLDAIAATAAADVDRLIALQAQRAKAK